MLAWEQKTLGRIVTCLISLKYFNFIKKIYRLNISGDFSHADDVCEGIYNLSLLKKNVDKIFILVSFKIVVGLRICSKLKSFLFPILHTSFL